jgi:GxxExxY protein
LRETILRVASPLAAEEEEVVTRVIDVGFCVHQRLGPGFKEKIYQRAFCLELDSRGMKYESEKPIDVIYKDWRIPGQKVDLIVEGIVLVELKAVPRLRPIHRSQVLSYLRTTGLRVAIVMNFNMSTFKAGVKRVVL